jgi:nucleoid-associated protein YgaU
MPVGIHSRHRQLEAVPALGRVGLAQRLLLDHRVPPGSLLHRIVGNETLDQLARRYYGREELWWVIADANPLRPPTAWRGGDTLIIPPRHLAAQTPRR